MDSAALLIDRGRADPSKHSDVLSDLEDMRAAGVDGAAIRTIHQEMALLSADTWRWLLPLYLSYCLTEDALFNRFETEFPIYNLGPELQFQSDTHLRLAVLNGEQTRCLIHLMEWCRSDPFNAISCVILIEAYPSCSIEPKF